MYLIVSITYEISSWGNYNMFYFFQLPAMNAIEHQGSY